MGTRKERNGHGFTAIRVVGGLLLPEFLQAIARRDAKHQSGADYGLSKSLALKDEIARYWRIANDLYVAFDERRNRVDLDKTKVTVDSWLVPFLKDVLNYSDLTASPTIAIGDRGFPITHTAFSGAVPIVLAVDTVDLDRAESTFGDEGRRRAAYGLVQETLNADDAKLWGIVSNGTTLRLLRDNPSLTRPAYIEANLERIFQEQLYADFAALWLTLHASRLRPVDGNPSSCVLEGWRAQAHETGERALEHLRDGVTAALRALGNGFIQHPNNEVLRTALRDGTLTADSYFQELLRLVYRFLFLLAAEDRHLLHPRDECDEQRQLYREGYSIARLREKALRRRHYDRYNDLWCGLLIVFRGLSDGAAQLALPALGGLFRLEQCPNIDRALVTNEALLEAVCALAYFRSGASLSRVNYRDMGTEELGSVYESLLELHPYLDVGAAPWAFGFVGEDNGEKAKGSTRKLTGSYYTPASLVQELVRSALEPVMQNAMERGREDPRAALLGLKVIDPACGSGHFLLAAARRIAGEIARIEADTDTPEETVRQHALREVVQHCIYGVDRNPLAVELCKTALWIETVEPGRPLTFLDPHVQCGDSLVGVLNPAILHDGIPDDAYKPLTGDDAVVCKSLKKRNGESGGAVQGNLFDQEAMKAVAETAAALEAMPEETLDDITAKRNAWERSRNSSTHRDDALRANLLVGAFFAEKNKGILDLVPLSEDLYRLNCGMIMRAGVEQFVSKLAERHRFFHWHIAFAEIMQRGGFDVVIGNPPWDVAQLGEEEFFAARAPHIANLSGVTRKRAIADLAQSNPRLWTAYTDALRNVQATNSFVRASGRYPTTARGRINTYALFAETFLQLIAPHGRAGLIAPTGIATDNSTRAFFEHISTTNNLISLFDFENREGLFPAVHNAQRFALITLGRHAGRAAFVFSATNVAHLNDPNRRFSLSSNELLLLNPNTRTVPLFRSNADAALTKAIYASVPVFVDESKGPLGNPWSVEFRQGLFNMTSDSALFRTAAEFERSGAERDGNRWIDGNGGRWLPLYEAKMIGFYDHRAGSYDSRGNERGYRVLPDTTDKQHADVRYEPQSFYWVKESDVHEGLPSAWKFHWLCGFKDITSASNERTFIPSFVPLVAVGNSMPLIFADAQPRLLACLLANLSSLILDFIARQKIGGMHVNFFYVNQFAVLPPSSYSHADVDFIVRRVVELSFTSEAMRQLATDLGFDCNPFPWSAERRALLRAELDAYFAFLYGLTRDELRYILDPTDIFGSDYPSETFRVLKAREVREYGEYRTARLVLGAWDALGVQNDRGKGNLITAAS